MCEQEIKAGVKEQAEEIEALFKAIEQGKLTRKKALELITSMENLTDYLNHTLWPDTHFVPALPLGEEAKINGLLVEIQGEVSASASLELNDLSA
jgi:hypothetical protein